MKLTYLETLSLAITQLMHIKCVAELRGINIAQLLLLHGANQYTVTE